MSNSSNTGLHLVGNTRFSSTDVTSLGPSSVWSIWDKLMGTGPLLCLLPTAASTGVDVIGRPLKPSKSLV